MRMLRIGCVASVLLSLMTGSAQAVRVALAPAPALENKSSDDQVFCAAAALWLHERLEQTPGVELMPEPRNTALFLEVNGGAREIPIATLQERLRASGAVIDTPTRLAATGRDDWSANRR